jgi:4,5-dihydroxyphthalate decarboxylase
MAITRSDRTEALISGDVRPKGVDLNVVVGTTNDIFYDMLRSREYDAAEMSLAAYGVKRSGGEQDLVAILVFPCRMFRHASLYVRADSPITSPRQLKGGRISVPDYQMTASVWVRHALQCQYALSPSDMSWVTGGLEKPSTRERIALRVPRGVQIERLGASGTLTEWLAASKLDVVLTPRAPTTFLRADGVRRLFANPREEERSYFKLTGIFPIMRTVVIRSELDAKHPWLAAELLRCFVDAKHIASARLAEIDFLPYALVWLVDERLEEQALFGQEPLALRASGQPSSTRHLLSRPLRSGHCRVHLGTGRAIFNIIARSRLAMMQPTNPKKEG